MLFRNLTLMLGLGDLQIVVVYEFPLMLDLRLALQVDCVVVRSQLLIILIILTFNICLLTKNILAELPQSLAVVDLL
jgi:hypothetical protein